MYIDDEIEYPPNLPKKLSPMFSQLKVYYDKDMWSEYELLWTEVESWVKSYYLDGIITRKDAVQIFHKHGIMI